ncbi:MAG: hypothetical protein LUE99_08400 [Bacteroides sp.]|nr:hypothetical protein [Bacteroides sp.]
MKKAMARYGRDQSLGWRRTHSSRALHKNVQTAKWSNAPNTFVSISITLLN